MPTLGGGAMGGGGDRPDLGKKRIDCDTETHDTERWVHYCYTIHKAMLNIFLFILDLKSEHCDRN